MVLYAHLGFIVSIIDSTVLLGTNELKTDITEFVYRKNFNKYMTIIINNYITYYVF